jgi:hypothetical protein
MNEEETPCPECHGAKSLTCPRCGGTTYDPIQISISREDSQVRQSCRRCQGTGTIACRRCQGNDWMGSFMPERDSFMSSSRPFEVGDPFAAGLGVTNEEILRPMQPRSPCPYCLDTGYRKCPRCGSAGIRWRPSYTTFPMRSESLSEMPVPENCPDCGGSGEIACDCGILSNILSRGRISGAPAGVPSQPATARITPAPRLSETLMVVALTVAFLLLLYLGCGSVPDILNWLYTLGG